MDLVTTSDELRRQYEKLLLKRDRYRYLAKRQLYAYQCEFGQLIADSFRKKISCVEKKKAIAFCQARVNRGEPVDQNALRRYLADEMAEYNDRLQEMIETNEAFRNAKAVPESELMKIKHIYRNLAKKLHPDIFPATGENDKLRELWNRVVDAYQRNNLQDISELEVLVAKALEDEGGSYDKIAIPNLEFKISKLESEIETIVSTDPYRYKDLLSDPTLVAEKKDELQREIEEYAAYEEELRSILDTLLMNGAIIQWEN